MASLRRVLQLVAHATVVVASSVLADAPRRGEVKIENEGAAGNPVKEGTCEGSEETCTLPTSTEYLDECGVWLAPSSLPGAGLGMYAGKGFEKYDTLLQSGDVVIPIVDIMMHQKGRKKFIFLWDEYTWNGKSLGKLIQKFHGVYIFVFPAFPQSFLCVL